LLLVLVSGEWVILYCFRVFCHPPTMQWYNIPTQSRDHHCVYAKHHSSLYSLPWVGKAEDSWRVIATGRLYRESPEPGLLSKWKAKGIPGSEAWAKSFSPPACSCISEACAPIGSTFFFSCGH
jgi:hypothetical protein